MTSDLQLQLEILSLSFPDTHNVLMSVKRYIRLFTEPPKEGEWQCAEKDIENALRRNVERVQQQTGTSEGRRESVYLGDVGE